MKLPTLARIPVVVLLMSACSLAPLAQPTSRPPPPVAATPTAAATPALPPLATPTELPTRSPAAAPTEYGGEVPPVATLSSGDVGAAGYPGSYCFADTCADIGGWPSKADLPQLTAGPSSGDLVFEIADQILFVTWSAAYGASSNDDESTPLGEGGDPFDPDTGGSPPPQFLNAHVPMPPPGDWVVWVWVDLESGDLSYAWHVIVP